MPVPSARCYRWYMSSSGWNSGRGDTITMKTTDGIVYHLLRAVRSYVVTITIV
jgi:hypothetical protein